jgi:excisionase family DNA binding protein
MQVGDPKRFVDQIVGTQGLYTTAQIEDYLRNAVISRLTDVLGENMKSIFDLPQLFDEIGAGMRAKVQDDFTAMGISLKQFMVVSITPTEETAKAIDERASMGAIGNMDAYLKYKAARAMGDAAQAGGSAGEGVGLGAGIGLGAGMAGMITSAMANAQQQPAQPQAAQPAAAATPGVMTLEEAAAYLKVSPADVQAVIDSGELKARKVGSQYRISKEAVDAFLAGS